MKQISILWGLLALLTFASCDKFLDELPDSRIDVDTPEKVAMLLSTAYPLGLPAAMFELMSDNTADNGVNYNYRYEWVPESYLYKDCSMTSYDTPHGVWERYFKAITTANTALVAIEEMKEQGHDFSAHIAEARICRAWSYFMLVNTFCQAYNPQSSATDLGMPYITVPITDVFAKFERGSVKEGWDKMNEDIEAALPDIDDDLYAIPKNHFNRKAAYCFAAEFNLYYGNYDKAVEYANIVLGTKPQTLLRDFNITKAMSSAADIRNQYINYDNACNLMIMSTYSQWGRIHNSTSSYPRYGHNREIGTTRTYRSPGPWSGMTGNRYNATSLSGFSSYGTGDQIIYHPKMTEIFETTDATLNTGYTHVVWVPFTVEKALLVRAEAYVLKGMYEEAAADLCMWYSSRHLAEVSLTAEEIIHFYKGVTFIENEEEVYTGAVYGKTKFDLNPRFTIQEGDQTHMLNAILHARRIEFLYEGWRWIDLKRYGIQLTHNVARQNDIVLTPWDNRYAIQLPYMVLAAGMEANPR